MKKKGILLTVATLLLITNLTAAQQGKLSGTIDVTYLSSYIWRGADVYGENHSAIQPSINLDLYGTGFEVAVFMSRANRSGFENSEELRTGLSYSNCAFEDEFYVTAYRVGWVYYNYPDNSTKAFDQQEVFISLCWPKLWSAGIVPRYTVAHGWPSRSHSTSAGDFGGWVHVLGLGCELTVPPLLPESSEQILHLSADVVYNDGIGPPGETVDHDWSHAVFGLSTDFDLGNNLTFTPAVYYQSSWDDSVNTQDETWVGLSMKYKF